MKKEQRAQKRKHVGGKIATSYRRKYLKKIAGNVLVFTLSMLLSGFAGAIALKSIVCFLVWLNIHCGIDLYSWTLVPGTQGLYDAGFLLIPGLFICFFTYKKAYKTFTWIRFHVKVRVFIR